jgi:hypothetical protein
MSTGVIILLLMYYYDDNSYSIYGNIITLSIKIQNIWLSEIYY